MLGWTRRPLTYRWGWYSSMVRPNGLIVINCLLDDEQVPRFVLGGTMHHEMLHMLTDPKVVGDTLGRCHGVGLPLGEAAAD